jgi:hypothetical protein
MRCYGKYAPSLLTRPWQETGPATGTSQTAYNEAKTMLEKDIADGLFRNLKTFTVGWRQTYTTEDYVSLLDTYSEHKRLKPDERNHLNKPTPSAGQFPFLVLAVAVS